MSSPDVRREIVPPTVSVVIASCRDGWGCRDGWERETKETYSPSVFLPPSGLATGLGSRQKC